MQGYFEVFLYIYDCKIKSRQLVFIVDDCIQLMIRVACSRAKVVSPEADRLMAVLHRPTESFFVIPQVIY